MKLQLLQGWCSLSINKGEGGVWGGPQLLPGERSGCHLLVTTECEVYSLNTALSVCTFLSSCEIDNFSCSHCDVTTRRLSPRSGLLSTVQGGRWTQLEDRGYSWPASTSPGAWSVITPVLLSSPALRPWLTTLQGHHTDNTKTSVATVDSISTLPVPRYKPDEYLHSTVHGARLLP